MNLQLIYLFVSLATVIAFPTTTDDRNDEVDSEKSRKIIGQSVVTSVSVIMNGDWAPQFTDAVGKTVYRPFVPTQVASPINLLNPDRYEFYTFNDTGELVKRLMTLKEIQSIVANGNGATIGDNEPESQSVILNTIPLSNKDAKTKVQDIVHNVQNVLNREMENNKNASHIPTQLLDTPDVSSSWSMILPAIFGNTGDEILPHRPINMTPETEIVDTTTSTVRIKTTTKDQAKTRPSSTIPENTLLLTKTPTLLTAITPIRKSTTKASTKTVLEATKPTKTLLTTEDSEISSETFAASTLRYQLSTTEPSNKQTSNTKLKPSSSFKNTTAVSKKPAVDATHEIIKTTRRPSVVKVSTSKKNTKKPTSVPFKRPLTNSPIIIEKIPKKPFVEPKTSGIKFYNHSENVTQKPSTTIGMKTNMSSKSSMSLASTTIFTEKKKSAVTRTEASITPTSKHQTSTNKPQSSTTTEQTFQETTVMTMTTEQTTLSTSEEDAINQIIGTLQSNFSKVLDHAVEKSGEINLVPGNVLQGDKLYIEEIQPIVKDFSSTTSVSDDVTLTDAPTFEKLVATTIRPNYEAIHPENSEVMVKIDSLIKEQSKYKFKNKDEKPNVLSFDEGDDTEIKLKDMMENKKHMTQSEFNTKAATIASVLSSKVTEPPITTVTSFEESETTVSTILSEALSEVIHLMIKKEEDKLKTASPSKELSGDDLGQFLHHYEELNFKQDEMVDLSLLSASYLPTEQYIDTTVQPYNDNVSYKSTVAKEISSGYSEYLSRTIKPENFEATTEGSYQELVTFFYIDNQVDNDQVDNDQDETTIDSINDKFDDFSTEQYVESKKRLSDRNGELYISPLSPIESSGIISNVLNVKGITSDEDEETSTEKIKTSFNSEDSDDIENAFLSLSSNLVNARNLTTAVPIVQTRSTIDVLTKKPALTTEDVNATENISTKVHKISATGTVFTGSTKRNQTNQTSLVSKQDLHPVNGSELLHLSIIRKDSSLEEINFITPPTPTLGIPFTEDNFIKIENINADQSIKPFYIALRITSTAKSSLIPDVAPTITSFFKDPASNSGAPIERVPLIEVTKFSEIPVSSTEENLVKIKVQTKPTSAITLSTEDHQPAIFQLTPNAQTIKNNIKNNQQQLRPQSPPIELSAAPEEALGLGSSTANLNTDLSEFSMLCNRLAFSFWKSIIADGISQSRSVIISPFALTSALSMLFLGARGQTSGEMNDLLRLDDMVSFNPHVVFRNISESIEQSRRSGIASAAFVRELYSDRSKGKLLSYFKEKAQQFYGAHVEEVNFNVINDILRRRTNLLVKRHTFGKINEYLKTNNIWVNEPLAAVSANVFLTDCSETTMSERDGEMFFQVSPAIRQRRLIPIPAAVFRSGFTAGYDPILDATAVAFGDDLQSTIMVMPGQQGSAIPGDNLERLESAFLDSDGDAWRRLLTTFMERPGLEVQIPRFSHRSLINTTFALQQMGLKDIFIANKADLRGLTGAKSNDLFFSDLLQINQFTTCGEDKISDSHHIEIYPSPSLKRELGGGEYEEDGEHKITSSDKNQYKSLFFDPIYDSRYMNVPLPLRPRQARLPENPRIRFDRPFLYFVRHNPTGIILFMGRFNPRLLP